MRLDARHAWGVVDVAAAAGAGLAMRWALRRGWRTLFAEEVPDNPAAPGVGWRSALLWAALSGVCVGSARVLAKRMAAGAFEAVAGGPPPLSAGVPR